MNPKKIQPIPLTMTKLVCGKSIGKVNVNFATEWKQHGDDAATLDRRGATYFFMCEMSLNRTVFDILLIGQHFFFG